TTLKVQTETETKSLTVDQLASAGRLEVSGMAQAKTLKVESQAETANLRVSEGANVQKLDASSVNAKAVEVGDRLTVNGLTRTKDIIVSNSGGQETIKILGQTGDIELLNADCAEQFDVCDAQAIKPGTVMVLGIDGKLRQSAAAYDKRVAGIVSGAGDYRPGIVLDRRQSAGNARLPIALLGKVFCWVDADQAPIEVGDLLTSSPTPGHAMKAQDPFQAFGAVIGKALGSLKNGRGLIPVLVSLQ
ncbi:MAG: hypothetical protein JXA14_18805, partial [Anaerolineae bacterium]|nr:hypothetical protein [Anaerolineae bacterium]